MELGLLNVLDVEVMVPSLQMSLLFVRSVREKEVSHLSKVAGTVMRPGVYERGVLFVKGEVKLK